ncbi:YesL family protein [Paenibacillus sp. P25]|nr:YesL family protein [Paenibacillus sp. P25]
MRLSVINVLWIICGIPFFLLGLILMQAQTTEQVLQTFLLMAIVSPFTLFPSTAAMFAVARKWLTGEEDTPLFKTFFRGYKENFVQSMLGGIIYMLLAVILYTNFRFYGNQSGSFGILRFLVMSLSVLADDFFVSLFLDHVPSSHEAVSNRQECAADYNRESGAIVIYDRSERRSDLHQL